MWFWPSFEGKWRQLLDRITPARNARGLAGPGHKPKPRDEDAFEFAAPLQLNERKPLAGIILIGLSASPPPRSFCPYFGIVPAQQV